MYNVYAFYLDMGSVRLVKGLVMNKCDKLCLWVCICTLDMGVGVVVCKCVWLWLCACTCHVKYICSKMVRIKCERAKGKQIVKSFG